MGRLCTTGRSWPAKPPAAPPSKLPPPERLRGGVLFHCGAGGDRTGLVSLLLLSLANVDPEANRRLRNVRGAVQGPIRRHGPRG